MSQCEMCGASEFREDRVNEIFWIEGQPILVENIPAKVCSQCGETTFSSETTEKIRQLLHSNTQPMRKISVDVFAFQ